MSLRRPDEERVWLQAMIASLGGLSSIDAHLTPADGEANVNWDRVNRELAEDAAAMADYAVREWRTRFPAEEPAAVPAPAEDAGL